MGGGAAVTILQGGQALPELAKPASAVGAVNDLIDNLENGNKDFRKDPLYQARWKMAHGAKFSDLTAAESNALAQQIK